MDIAEEEAAKLFDDCADDSNYSINGELVPLMTRELFINVVGEIIRQSLNLASESTMLAKYIKRMNAR